MQFQAQSISEALGGRRSGKGFRVPAVCHGSKNRNLHIQDGHNGKLLATCFSQGCEYKHIMETLESLGVKEKAPFKPDPVKAKSRSIHQTQKALTHELYILLQYTEERLNALKLITDRAYMTENPQFVLPPAEPWDRELLAVKRIRTGLKIIYGEHDA